jgi:hypothetical protein
MSDLKEMMSVLKRIWNDDSEKTEIDSGVLEKILSFESENQEDSAKAKQSISHTIEQHLAKQE